MGRYAVPFEQKGLKKRSGHEGGSEYTSGEYFQTRKQTETTTALPSKRAQGGGQGCSHYL